MATHLKPHESSVPANQGFPKIDKFFDAAEHIVERSEVLLSKCKPLLIHLFLFIETIVVLVFVLIFVLTK